MTQQQAILATLVYHDIFDYPLKAEEIHSYLISAKANLTQVKKTLVQLLNQKRIIAYSSGGAKRSREVSSTGKFSTLRQAQDSNNISLYALSKRNQLFKLRKQREIYSEAKLKVAKIYASILKFIPTVKLVAISGALAMQNCTKNDDIDLVIVTSKDALWTTRLLASLLLFPVKRRPSGKKISNRACLNLFLDESHLAINEENLYTAHEIAQMKLLWNRDNTYQKFVKSNSWIKKFLPNWQPDTVNSKSKIVNRGNKKVINSPFTIHHSLIENLLKNFQLNYMRHKITTEKIGEGQLFFHPKNIQETVLSKYKRRLKLLKNYSYAIDR